MIDEYKAAGIDPKAVFTQSFNLNDILYWIKSEPAFGAQATYLDDRYEKSVGFNNADPNSWKPGMKELADQGVKIIAPPLWVLVTLNDKNEIVPSEYAKAARAAGLDIITWSLERSGPLNAGGGLYYQSIKAATDHDGDRVQPARCARQASWSPRRVLRLAGDNDILCKLRNVAMRVTSCCARLLSQFLNHAISSKSPCRFL